MILNHSLLLFMGVATTIVGTSLGIGSLPLMDPDRVFDQGLHESVLDPELCAKQLQYIRNEDFSLRLQFLDSGLRLPRGILRGNLFDFGDYPQCLSINKEVEDMTIQGKHCLLNVPLDSLPLQNEYDLHYLEPNSNHTRLLNEKMKVIKEIEKEKELFLTREGKRTDPFRANNLIDNDSTDPSRIVSGIQGFSLFVSICIPQSCTPQEALESSIFNINGNMNDVQVRSCRLPDDKPFVAADYIAWVIFSILGLITVFSTMYDVHHIFILKKDSKQANELYSAFSVYKNSCKIINLTSRSGTLECLDGIRALSIIWVVIGHTFMMGIYFPANPVDVLNYTTKAIWMKTAELAVDTFFLLSGLLVVYTTASKFTPMKLLKNLHLFYLHRFLRLMPVLAVVILFVSSIQHHIGDGPAWLLVAGEVENCRSYWWVTLLHLQNFLTPEGACVSETWYLAIDMQLHLLSPMVLFWIYSGAKRPAWMALISTFLVSLTASTIYVFLKDFSVHDSHIYHYLNILTRAPPFFVGLIYGYLLHLYRDRRCELSKTVGYSVTVFMLGVTALVLYCNHIHTHGDISVTIEKVFMSFERTAWVICVGWIIFACVNGYAGPINWFLSMSVWKIPSRISYSMYLTHMTVIMYAYHGSAIAPVYFSVPLFMFDFMAFLYLTIFVSFFVTALIDLPFATLFRILLMGGNKPQKKPVTHTENEMKIEVRSAQEK